MYSICLLRQILAKASVWLLGLLLWRAVHVYCIMLWPSQEYPVMVPCFKGEKHADDHEYWLFNHVPYCTCMSRKISQFGSYVYTVTCLRETCRWPGLLPTGTETVQQLQLRGQRVESLLDKIIKIIFVSQDMTQTRQRFRWHRRLVDGPCSGMEWTICNT